MSSIFELANPFLPQTRQAFEHDWVGAQNRNLAAARLEKDGQTRTVEILATAADRNGRRIMDAYSTVTRQLTDAATQVSKSFYDAQMSGTLLEAASAYQRDAYERAILSADALRKRGDIFLEHEAADCPPVLIYDYEVVMDGRDLPHPSNYFLLQITPPEGVTVDPERRPYIIIDPRAGHGPGIGGFKSDSQVGVALRDGHPVYFVAFRSRPEPGQYLANVMHNEAAFVREVMRRHPKSPKPIITGNCQGGWATLLLAAANTDLTGPIVINGAPVAPWAGVVGENPMRYNGGVLGGAWLPMFFSDLGGGLFDGAHLVSNFELLNPSRTLFRKYTDLFRDIDKGDKRFLEFERWWGGFFLLTEPEIRWIVEQLFVGNRLAKNEARLEPGRPIDLKAIRAPIIVFASHGDNITPPQQALGWIPDTYADVDEIRIRGQRIIYMVHDQVGHLGIFVSSQIARKEHTQIASTLKTIEALAPGLYEMVIQDVEEKDGEKRFTVGFVERTLDDIRAIDDSVADERPFAAVARTSEVQAQLYEALARPFVQAAVTPASAELSRALHPQRLSRALASSRNPAMSAIEKDAERVRSERNKAPADNPFLAAEAFWADAVEHSIDLWRDARDMTYELTFHSLWGTPWARTFGKSYEARRTLKTKDELRGLPQVATALANIERGSIAEAVARMLILIADAQGGIQRERLERASAVMTTEEPFASLDSEQRMVIINEQTLIATYEPVRAVETLPLLLADEASAARAMELVDLILGEQFAMTDQTARLVGDIRRVLGDAPEARAASARPQRSTRTPRPQNGKEA